ncbi:MAG: ABC transporter substrate-binding protein, partial [Leptonema sp. (in: bacteria)]
MNKIYKILLLIILINKSILPQNSEKNVLVLHSYHKGLSWTEQVIEGIESVFNNKVLTTYNIKIFYEYMDTKRFEDENYLQLLIPIYKYKAQKIKYDVIIAVDDNALNFLLKHRNQIFGEIPIVFCGINFYDETRIHTIKNITGVVEAFSAKENIELILKLHPNTNHIVVV